MIKEILTNPKLPGRLPQEQVKQVAEMFQNAPLPT